MSDLFFDPPDLFEDLKNKYLTDLLKKKANKQVRVWIPDCGTGEDVYSLGFLFRELLPDSSFSLVRLFGTDSNHVEIKKAREGIYKTSQVINVSKQEKECFFRVTETGDFKITESIRQNCLFGVQDILKDSPLSHIDLIVFRSTSHWSTPLIWKKIFPVLFNALNTDGILVLSGSPYIPMQMAELKELNAKNHIYLKIADHKRINQNIFQIKKSELSEVKEMQTLLDELSLKNEEFLIANEELETSKEELNINNEELKALNTELIDRNTELSQTIQDLNNLLESMDMPIIMLGTDFRIRRFNSQAEKLMNLIPNDQGRKFTDIRPKIKIENFKELLQDFMKNQKDLKEEFRDEKGSWYLLKLKPYSSKDRQGIVLYLVDINRQKQAEKILNQDKALLEKRIEERSRELERAKHLSDIGTLSAIVAHELRNPLAAINMAAENIRRKGGETQFDRQIKTIRKKIQESDQIINNLLFYARIKSPHFESTFLNEILDECIETIPDMERKKIQIQKQYDGLAGHPLWVDPVQMKELFFNIINNAVDAIKTEGSTIEIKASTKDKNALISVKDNGIGIKKEHLEKLKEPFFTTKAKGTGLGLTVASEIIHLHNGSIEIESEWNKGTLVTVILPIRKSK